MLLPATSLKRPPEALIARLEGISEPAILLSPNYVVVAANQAYQNHYGSKATGEHCYAVSHGYDSPCDENGEDCPLQKARSSKRNERVFHVHHGPQGAEHVDVSLEPIADESGKLLYFIERISHIEVADATARGAFVGRSRPFSEMLGLLRRGAPSEVPMLLLGESGTGKELAAKAIHDASGRKDGPFVPVECSGLGEALFESELFGHAKGAFTGAHHRKPGLVDAATGGTLFLDEIGDVPLSLQVKLLRLLESRTFRAVGDINVRRADFRLVCATHRDLKSMVEEGSFRRDLYYRINTFPLHMPALRERPQDLALLATSLLKGSGKSLSAEALNFLEHYPFPGNVRELRNLLERAVLLTDGNEIEASALPREVREEQAPSNNGTWPWGDALLPLEEVERRYLEWAKDHHPKDRRHLAQRLGLSERTLYRKLAALEELE